MQLTTKRRLRAVIGVSALTLLAAACDYPMLGGSPARTNNAAGETTISSANAHSLKLLAGFPKDIGLTRGQPGSIQSPPVVANNSLFLSGLDGNVHSYDLNGNAKWTFRMAAPNPVPPTVADGTAYAVDGDGFVYALDASSGTRRWTATASGALGIASSPAVVGGSVFVGGVNNVYQFSTADGHLVRTYTVGRRITTPVAVSGSRLYLGGDNGGVSAFDTNSGSQVWHFACQSTSCPATIGVAVAGNLVVAGRQGGVPFALDANTGNKVWSTSVTVETAPAVAFGNVYFGTANGGVKALALSDGHVVASVSDNGPRELTIANNVVFTAEPLNAYDAGSLTKVWQSGLSEADASDLAIPVVANGRVFAINTWGQLVEYGL